MNLQNIDSKGFRSADLNTKQGDNINIESLQKNRAYIYGIQKDLASHVHRQKNLFFH